MSKALAIVIALLLLTAAFPGVAQEKKPVHTLNHPCLIADYGGNRVCIIGKDGTVNWEVKAARPQDVWMLANGNVLFSHLKIVKEVKLQTTAANPHARMRKARKTKNGTYLVGQYADAVIREYDGDGKIIREYKQKNAFGASRLPNGNLLLSTGDAHTIKEIDPDDKVVWQIDENELPGNPLRFVAGLQRLPNGNTLVCNWGGHGHIGKQPQVFEVTRDKKVVGELFDYKRFKTISGVYALDVKGDPSKFEIMR